MSKTIEQQAAEVIERFLPPFPGKLGEEQATKTVRALAEHQPRLLTPELPEANDPDAAFVPDGKGWVLENEDTGPRGPLVWTAPGGLVMIQRIEPGELAPEDARTFAHNILAAADHSESEGA